jgi:hypothetical protein
METSKQTRNLVVSRYDEKQNIFYLKPQNEELEVEAVYCKIKLQGQSNEKLKKVNTLLPQLEYDVVRFTNPFLNAENDLFKIKFEEKSIGYIIPYAAIEEGDENDSEEFDEPKQAYKYYCIKSILEGYNFGTTSSNALILFSELVDSNSIFIILYKPLIEDKELKIEDFLPSLALKGYYYFPDKVIPSVLNLTYGINHDPDLYNLIESKFFKYRNNESITIKETRNVIERNPIMQILYKKLLTESSNPLHRFLILYQVIEFLVDKKIRTSIDKVFREKDSYTNFKFVQRINEINNTRSTIKNLYDGVIFEDKNEITNTLRNFILIFDSDYKSQSTGDCFYDIRNLLFHDFKSVLEKNQDGIIICLVIHCETLIHQLLLTIGNEGIVSDIQTREEI